MDKNGVSLSNPKTEDMENIQVYVANTTPIPVTSEEFKDLVSYLKKEDTGEGSKVKINPNITLDTFKSLTTLEEIIPNGFVLLHNDLIALMGSKEGSGGGGGFNLSSIAKGLGAGLGVAAVAAGGAVLESLFNGTDSETQKHMEEIITELNLELTADDFRGDPEVERIQRESFLQYLKTYYLQQTMALAGSAVGSALGEAVSSLIDSTFGKLIDLATGKEEAPSKLAIIAEELDKGLTYESIASDTAMMDQVKVVQRNAVINYLKAYYYGQVAELVGATVGDTLGGAIGNTLKGAFSGLIEGTLGTVLSLFGKNKKEDDPEADKLATIAETLTGLIDANDYVNDEQIKEVQKKAIVNYLKAYYAGINSKLTTENIGDTISNTLSEGISGVVEGVIGGVFSIFGKKEEEAEDPQITKIQSVVNTLVNNIKAEDYIGDSDIIAAQKTAILEYVKLYYAAQTSELLGETGGNIAANFLGSIGEGINRFFTNLFGGDKSEETVDNFTYAVSEIIKIDPTQFTQDSSLNDIKKKYLFQAAEAILAKENEAIISNYKADRVGDGFEGRVKEALSGFKDAYLNSLGNAMGVSAQLTFSTPGSPISEMGAINGKVGTLITQLSTALSVLRGIERNTAVPSNNVIVTNSGSNIDEELLRG